MSFSSNSNSPKESEEHSEDFKSTSTDDLEKAIMIAAADANSHAQNEDSKEETPSKKFKPNNESSDKSNEKSNSATVENISNFVASHYNSIEEKGKEERSKSRIVYMRNFHNWIKSMLINEYLTKIKEKKHNAPLRVLDIGCGKGGDLLKWKSGKISHLICSDIAQVSLEQCRKRYDDMKQRSRDGRLFSIETIHADCTRSRLRERYSDPSLKLDLVSCQFAFHYSFESLPQAETMLRNAAECLNPGGYFIGTMPDANDLLSRARKSKDGSFGNKVFRVVFDETLTDQPPPLFGAKYNFYLEEVVDCPEFLVHFPTLVKLAKKFGLKLIHKEKFYDFFYRMKSEGRQLLSNMSALEGYPPHPGSTPLGTTKDDYEHADYYRTTQDIEPNSKIGTLSKSEWEASSLYLTFAFEKVKNTWNVDGTPCYDFS